MAVEAKRGCGFRKVGGLYLVDDGAGMPCCKMPLALTVCPCCGEGIKQARSWTWVDAGKLFPAGGCKAGPVSQVICPASQPTLMGRVGLIWVGEKFYPRPVDFLNEAGKQGISRRLPAIPRGYKAGETWVLFAHPKAIERPRTVEQRDGEWVIVRADGREEEDSMSAFEDREDALRYAASLDLAAPVFVPGVIRIAKPRGFEKIVKQSDFDAALADRATWEANDDPKRSDDDKSALLRQFEKDAERGITWIPVPDDDPDHQGTVYDSDREEVA